MQMQCQLLLKRSHRCENFDYSGLRKAFPQDASPIVEDTNMEDQPSVDIDRVSAADKMEVETNTDAKDCNYA